MNDQNSIDRAPPPSTLTVLGLLALTALTFSYLGAYAVYNVLVTTQMIAPYTGADPRPRWLLMGFCIAMLVLMILGEICRRLSQSDMNAIDAMVDEETIEPRMK